MASTIVTPPTSTGYAATFSYAPQSGAGAGYTFAGDVIADTSKKIRTLSGTITNTSTSVRVGSFSLAYSTDDQTIQDNITTALEAVRDTVASELPSA